jgi:hypothetical protein
LQSDNKYIIRREKYFKTDKAHAQAEIWHPKIATARSQIALTGNPSAMIGIIFYDSARAILLKLFYRFIVRSPYDDILYF